jgi:hypothetical protein
MQIVRSHAALTEMGFWSGSTCMKMRNIERPNGQRSGIGRSAVLSCIISLLLSCPAGAADGPCKLETGMWASPVEACQHAMNPSEALSRYGERALLELHPGYYRYEGARCTVFSNTLASKRCTLVVECADGGIRSHGQWDITIESDRQFRFGTRVDSPTYHHCTDETPLR